MKTFIVVFLCLLFYSQYAQTWAPTNSPLVGRYDDISFVSPDTGWAVGFNTTNGYINYTKDGGATWTIKKTLPGVYMRSIEFANKNIGFAGGLEYNGQNVFFKTIDGGTTWTDISSVISGIDRGICGICCVNTSVTYAVGVYTTPAYVMKTIDGGNTWTKISMVGYANALVDVQFTDANNGFVVGLSNVASEGAVILKTADGGQTWVKVFKSNVSGEYVWKIQNLDGINWFASIERGGTPNGLNVFLKSVNGGNTWVSKPVATTQYFQGIGFINAQKGWIGNYDLYETNDGGNTWASVIGWSASHGFNRFQKINATTAYFSSEKVYKLSNTTTEVKENTKQEERNWLSVYPNPAKGQIAYHLNLPNKTMFVTRVFNSKNEIIWEEVNQKEKGSYQFKTPITLEPGIYFLYIMFNEGIECKKVIVE